MLEAYVRLKKRWDMPFDRGLFPAVNSSAAFTESALGRMFFGGSDVQSSDERVKGRVGFALSAPRLASVAPISRCESAGRLGAFVTLGAFQMPRARLSPTFRLLPNCRWYMARAGEVDD